MEQQSQATPEEKQRREELFRVIEKIRKAPLQKKHERARDQLNYTNGRNGWPQRRNRTHQFKWLNGGTGFQKHLGATGVRYIQVGQESHVKEINESKLEERVSQAEPKFSTDLKKSQWRQQTMTSYFFYLGLLGMTNNGTKTGGISPVHHHDTYPRKQGPRFWTFQ